MAYRPAHLQTERNVILTRRTHLQFPVPEYAPTSEPKRTRVMPTQCHVRPLSVAGSGPGHGCTAFTIARMPARSGFGSFGQAVITSARSGDLSARNARQGAKTVSNFAESPVFAVPFADCAPIPKSSASANPATLALRSILLDFSSLLNAPLEVIIFLTRGTLPLIIRQLTADCHADGGYLEDSGKEEEKGDLTAVAASECVAAGR
jgi:hypothetical protein